MGLRCPACHSGVPQQSDELDNELCPRRRKCGSDVAPGFVPPVTEIPLTLTRTLGSRCTHYIDEDTEA